MNGLTLAAGQWRDENGRLADHALELDPVGPRLEVPAPDRVVVTGTLAGSDEFVRAEVDRHAVPPEQTGPEREEYDPADSYSRGDPVWVWSVQSRTWCPGRVDAASHIAVQVTYEPTGQRGTVTDTVPPCYVARRQTPDTTETSPTAG